MDKQKYENRKQYLSTFPEPYRAAELEALEEQFQAEKKQEAQIKKIREQARKQSGL